MEYEALKRLYFKVNGSENLWYFTRKPDSVWYIRCNELDGLALAFIECKAGATNVDPDKCVHYFLYAVAVVSSVWCVIHCFPANLGPQGGAEACGIGGHVALRLGPGLD